MRVIEWVDAVYGTMRCAREANFNGCVEVSNKLLEDEAPGDTFTLKPKSLISLRPPNGYEEHCWSFTSYEDILEQLQKSYYYLPTEDEAINMNGNKI